MQSTTHEVAGEAETKSIGARLAEQLHIGDVVLFKGELGAGKTTMIRGLIEALGNAELVRSPTYNLIQTFDTHPPVMHADLYRLSTAEGIGLEDYFENYACLIEWPDRLHGMIDRNDCWQVEIDFAPRGRVIKIAAPRNPLSAPPSTALPVSL